MKNSGYTLVSSVLGGVLLFLTNTLIARAVGPEDFGTYTFILAFLSFFTMIANLGMDSIVVRELSKDAERKNSMVTSALVLKSFFSLIGFGIAAVLIVVLNYPTPIQQGVFVAGMTLVTGALVNLWWAVFQSRFEMIWYAATHVLGRIVLFATTLLFLYARKDLLWLVGAHTVAGILQLVIATSILWKKAPFAVRVDKAQIVYLVRESWPLALAGLFVSLYYRIDVFMLSFWKPQEDIGYYAAVYTLTEATALIAIAWNASLYPLLSRLHNKKEEFVQWGRTSVKMLFFLASWLITTIVVLSPQIIHLIYGQAYESSIPTLRILIWGGGIIMINIILASMLNALGHQKITTRATGINLLLNIALNIWAIPRYGIWGAAATTVFTELSCGVMMVWTLKRMGVAVFEKKWVWKSFVANGIIAIFLLSFSPQGLGFVTFAIMMSIVGYILFLFVLKTTTIDDDNILKHLFWGKPLKVHTN